jgi:hypothetical protein
VRTRRRGGAALFPPGWYEARSASLPTAASMSPAWTSSPSRTRTSSTTPAAKLSTGSTALSVSASTSTSPRRIVSPAWTFTLTILASSVVCPASGILIS